MLVQYISFSRSAICGVACRMKLYNFTFFYYKQQLLTFLYLIYIIIINSYIYNYYMSTLFIQEKMGDTSQVFPVKDAKPEAHFLLNRWDQTVFG